MPAYDNLDENYDPRTGARVSRPSAVPVRAILLAVSLFAAGCILLPLGLWWEFSGHDHALSMIVVGSLVFLPGSYYTYTAFKAWRGDEGYSFDDIPEV